MTFDEKFLAKIAGWQAMKEGRGILASDRVLSAEWNPPLLRGVVQAGGTSYQSGLVLKSERDIENLCTCRESRQWGKICGHSVAVGLRALQPDRSDQPEQSDRSDQVDCLDQVESWLRRAEEGVPGTPLALSLILAPNVAAALNQGRLTVHFQAEVEGVTKPLTSVDRELSYELDAADSALLSWAEEKAGGEPPAMLSLSVEQWAEVLPLLAGYERLSLGRKTKVEVWDRPWAPAVRARLREDGSIGLELDGPMIRPEWIGAGWVWRESEHRFQRFGLPAKCLALAQGPVELSRLEVPAFLQEDYPKLEEAGAVRADFNPEDFQIRTEPPVFRLHLSGGMAVLRAELACVYGSREFKPGESGDALFVADPEEARGYWLRDFSSEKKALAQLTLAGFAGPDRQGIWELRDEDRVLEFFARRFPRLRRNWEVTLSERLSASTERNLQWVEPRFEMTSSGVSWFDMEMSYTGSDGAMVPASEIQSLLRSGRSFGKRGAGQGKVVLLDTEAMDEFQEVLRDCAPEQQEGRYRLDRAQAGFLRETIEKQRWQWRGSSAWQKQAGLAGKPVCPPLGELETVLRPYQKQGVAWMRFLAEHEFGGILADEMGLGKTVQTLAFVRWLREQADARQAGPCLVVCPASLVANWMAEARRFVPGLKAVAWHGAERHGRVAEAEGADLLVTTYGLVHKDDAFFRAQQFESVILDEAQHIKNRETQNARAVKSVRGRHRLVLTGTPMENSVLDLWSIFDFLMPGYLGSARDFRERYEIPITRERCARTQARLSRRIKPFVLRRLKRSVARELPDKIEQVAYCDLLPGQAALYRQLLEAGRQALAEPSGGAGKGGAGGKSSTDRLAVLNVLLRLRQVCCDPRLFPAAGKTVEDSETMSSGKMELLGELLQEAIDGGHRVLVFSQFTSMLRLIGDWLREADMAYCYLDGATRHRAAEVERFQRETSIPVFLISLKAGGVGLNLTGADTVIHFDPWWNPAVETQATDRAHRIGQTKVVTSYKLIARDTVEDKILQLQQRKRELVAAAMEGEHALAEALSWEDIQSLLS